jgi:hypothetical protein
MKTGGKEGFYIYRRIMNCNRILPSIVPLNNNNNNNNNNNIPSCSGSEF